MCALGSCAVALTMGCSKSNADRASRDRGASSPAASTAASSARTARELFEKEAVRAYPIDAPTPKAKRTYELRAAPTAIPQVDGHLVEVWAYNGQVPGPVLRVRLGEELEVHFKNDLPQPTTVHWHGVRVPNAMDGVPGITQDPVPPGGTFTYRFTPKDAGTFWFHPHVRSAEQVERGLYGVLIVEDASPPPYPRDEIWVIDDWRLTPDGQVDPRFVTRSDLAHDGRWGQWITVNGIAVTDLTMRPGERIRLRLLNTSNGRIYQPDFGALEVKVIAVDGNYTAEPLAWGQLVIAPGNRVDVDVIAPKPLAGKTIEVVDRFFARRPNALASVHVRGEPVETPSFEAPRNPHVPRWEGAENERVDHTFVLNARPGGTHGIAWTINGNAWEHEGDAHHATPPPEVTKLKAQRWVRVRFQNDSARLHPMHMHGLFFKVLARNGKAAPEPYFHDTILVGPRESVDVGIVPLDLGRWMMHCHILEHAEAGMMTLVEVTP